MAVVMVTGPRGRPDVDGVVDALTYVVTRLHTCDQDLSVLSGGAAGAGSATVDAAARAGVSVDIGYPHPGYLTHYALEQDAEQLFSRARSVRYTIADGPFGWRHNPQRNTHPWCRQRTPMLLCIRGTRLPSTAWTTASPTRSKSPRRIFAPRAHPLHSVCIS